MFKRFGLWGAACALLLTSLTATAQETSGLPTLAGVVNDRLELWAGDTRQIITEMPTYKYNAVFSPDGTKLAYTLSASADPFDSNRTVFVYDGSTSVPLVSAYLATGMPISWTPDGQILYMTGSDDFIEQDMLTDVYVIQPQAGAEPDLIAADVPFGVGCGGGSSVPLDIAWWEEADLGGGQGILQLTEYGIVHSGACVGARTSLTRPFSGETIPFVGGQLTNAAVSPDGQKVAGVARTPGEDALTISVIDLATLEESNFMIDAPVTQVAWSADGSLYYTTRAATSDFLTGLTPEQIKQVSDVMGIIEPPLTTFPGYTVGIGRLNPTDGSLTPLYSAPAYVIPRLAVVENQLIFSEVSDASAWLEAIFAGEVTFENNFEASEPYVTVALRVLDVSAATATASEIAPDFRQFVAAGS